jgi:hypothetical protein
MYASPRAGRIRQGDVFKDIVFRDAYNTVEGDVTADFCVVLSQDCDLLQSHKNLKAINKDEKGEIKYSNVIPRVLVCPAYVAEQLREGDHMARINWGMARLNSDKWNQVKINETPRYHYLKESVDFSLPALVLDFKHIHTLPVSYLKKDGSIKVAQLEELFAQEATQRHAHYVSRVAIPNPKDNDKDD